jgi:hypothetical protein
LLTAAADLALARGGADDVSVVVAELTSASRRP